MKTKHTLVILAIGFILIFIGALFKIIHFEIGFISGNLLLIVGTFCEIFGGILFLYKLLINPKFKDFLNS
ncbi:MAG TPA: hypothetical protein VLZ72_05835 [Flavobacterium sp.]|nr:hypothetical protein [Flavobacterium sp.]